MQRVTIIGMGLIGGSIGLGLRRWAAANKSGNQPALEVTGFDTDLEQQQYAQKLKAIDRGAWDLAKAVSDADIVVIATPVAAMKETFESITPHLRQGTTVTDVGSTKAEVLRWANEIFPAGIDFVGGHPMAGKTQSIEGADADLFQGATWCVAPAVSASDESVRNVLGMIAALNAESFFVDPVEHDGFVAGVSHLPFVLSSALMRTVSKNASWRDMKTLTAGGFRDVSRLAAGSPAMHRDILLTNREAVLRWLNEYIATLIDVRDTLGLDPEAAAPELTEFFTQARDARAEWSTQTTREGELLQGTAGELSSESMGQQVGRMLLGGLARRKPTTGKNERPDRADRD